MKRKEWRIVAWRRWKGKRQERVSMPGMYAHKTDALWDASCIPFFEDEEVEFRLDYRWLVPGPWQFGEKERYGRAGAIKAKGGKR